ncbi:MAG: hypothetical protein M3439_13450 [Chloroflexota bacterium]|nr:hypothetical protein [Chloroflexota bacterium]
MVAYQPATAAQAFERVLHGEDPRLSVGDFLDDWRRTPSAERAALVADPIGDPGNDLGRQRWAAFYAAMIDQLCWTNEADRLPRPGWTSNAAYRLAEPWFLVDGWPLRAWQLVSTPVPFRMRNIYGGDNILARV